MHNPRLHDLKLRRVLRPFILAAALCLTPALAAQANEASKSGDQAQATGQSSGTAQATSQSGGAYLEGGEITLSQQEASEWDMRPVVNESGEKIGQVTAISLNQDGKISEVEVELAQTMGLGGKTVTLAPDQFSANKEHVKLDMSMEDLKELPEAQ